MDWCSIYRSHDSTAACPSFMYSWCLTKLWGSAINRTYFFYIALRIYFLTIIQKQSQQGFFLSPAAFPKSFVGTLQFHQVSQALNLPLGLLPVGQAHKMPTLEAIQNAFWPDARALPPPTLLKNPFMQFFSFAFNSWHLTWVFLHDKIKLFVAHF